jgi:hypothetical protein
VAPEENTGAAPKGGEAVRRGAGQGWPAQSLQARALRIFSRFSAVLKTIKYDKSIINSNLLDLALSLGIPL